MTFNTRSQIKKLIHEFKTLSRISTFTNDQRNAFNVIKSIIDKQANNEPYDKIISIEGGAGVGKTWLTSQIIDIFHKEIQITFTAPTHEALGVAKNMLKEIDVDISTKTIHSFLNLKLDYGLDGDDEITGKAKLVPNKYKQDAEYTNLLLIDESSMNSEEMYKNILSVLGTRAKIILFVGDPCQLKPVEGGENPIFNNPDIVHLELNEIVRQKKDNTLIKMATDIRHLIKNKQYPNNIIDYLYPTDHVGVCYDDSFLQHYYTNPFNKMIGSYTNRMVESYNNHIRFQLTGSTKYLIVGDVIVFQEPFADGGDNLLFQTGEVCKITKIVEETDYINLIRYYRVSCEYLDSDDNLPDFIVLDPNDKESFKNYNNMLNNALLDAKASNSKTRKNLWIKYFKLKNKFAKIRYNYARTLHKLQGSTKHTLYLDARDFEYFYRKDPDMVLRLIYVALTRPSDLLIILK
ncbi:MAG: AAA family ATPase [Sphaerochaeta sp.]|jgi:hypothetical protein